jgi:hypothetical protein
MNHLRASLFLAACSTISFAAHPLLAEPSSPTAMADRAAAPGKLVPVDAKTDATWLAQARASYPLNSCVVSGDAFDGGEMGKQMDYIYRQDGQPDRLVRMCCKDCAKDFRKDPAKYLKSIDDAAAAKAKNRA